MVLKKYNYYAKRAQKVCNEKYIWEDYFKKYEKLFTKNISPEESTVINRIVGSR
jgi:hypothetical protein